MILKDGELLEVQRITESGVIFNKDFLRIQGPNRFIEGYSYKVQMHKKGEALFKCINDNTKSLLIEEV